MITRYGMSEELGPETYESDNDRSYFSTRSYSDKTATAIDEEVKQMLKDAYSRAESILTEHRDELDKLADYLLENEKIDGDAFLTLMESKQ